MDRREKDDGKRIGRKMMMENRQEVQIMMKNGK